MDSNQVLDQVGLWTLNGTEYKYKEHFLEFNNMQAYLL